MAKRSTLLPSTEMEVGMIGSLYSVDARFKKQGRKGKQKQKAIGAVLLTAVGHGGSYIPTITYQLYHTIRYFAAVSDSTSLKSA